MIEKDFQIKGDIGVITCYFNPNGYETKRNNYNRFVDHLAENNVSLVTIECAFNDDSFDLPMKSNNLQVRTNSIMWQKERLLNIAISKLPKQITKIAWVDCDVVFENKKWLSETSSQLEKFSVIQPFELVVRLPKDSYEDTGEGVRNTSFGAIFAHNPSMISSRGTGTRHGHSGYAWAARREALQFGLYDGCISGNGDHLMAHAFVGDWETECFRSHFEYNYPYWKHFESWCKATYPYVRAKVGYLQGNLLHLWHGESNDRKYMERNQDLNAFDFDPATDITIGNDGCYSWNTKKPDLHRWAVKYFGVRYEDGRSFQNPTTDMLIDRLERAKDRAGTNAHKLRISKIINDLQFNDSIEIGITNANAALGIKN